MFSFRAFVASCLAAEQCYLYAVSVCARTHVMRRAHTRKFGVHKVSSKNDFAHISYTNYTYRIILVQCCTKEILRAQRLKKIRGNIAANVTGFFILMLISQLSVLTGAATVCFSFLLVASCLVVDAGGLFLFMLIWCRQRHLLLHFYTKD